MNRQCTRSGCKGRAVATLTYAYADSTAVLGPLALQATPGCYDLCATHASKMTAPQGWEIIRLADPESLVPEPDEDDLLALANAVREVGFSDNPASNLAGDPSSVVELGRRGHLRVIQDAQRNV
ncbi:DUF3499 domain-containing protein [Propionimicrobium sp. PCR01-08-3]|uniref:DUF3499 domain-containing protein n=1 Tax=Propionimicrobium sp. PCR01-08-3 TaxID=3052086 RepID=UPI00255CB9AA|nr:DUF3499 domain-containing protein [Propionimicrobium sp. PCR01-08-3]WIY84167.1 DUF3499 domain-containing protein [Propionimicrobium sp. PCR01-08-3]